MKTKLKLISFDLCPYVQRARIVLNEKNIPYDIEFIDLKNKPQWFLEISPTGKVPVLLVDDQPLFESSVICEYLDEVTEGSLHPADPFEKARHRSYIEFASSMLLQSRKFYTAEDQDAFLDSKEQLRESIAKVESTLVGPYFSGDEFHVVDAVYATVFRNFAVFKRDFGVNLLAEFKRVQDWAELLLHRKSVRQSVEADFDRRLGEFFRNRESELSAIKVS